MQALNTLKKPDGYTIAVEGFYDRIRPLSARQKQILEEGIPKKNEAAMKRALGVERWIADESFHDSQVRLPMVVVEATPRGQAAVLVEDFGPALANHCSLEIAPGFDLGPNPAVRPMR